MEKVKFIIKGNIAYSEDINTVNTIENGYIVCVDGLCAGAYKDLPEKYKNLPMLDYTDKLIIPGMTDMHVHAPQYTFRGLGMDMELLEWLQINTFPEEAKYRDINYAKEAYKYFVDDLSKSYTTRACIFGTLHREATVELMNQLEDTGLVTYVGKVNMDRNGSDELCEASAEESLSETVKWLLEIAGKYKRTMPIITPRFTPCCTDELMKQLSVVAKEKKIRVQSHLSENQSEIAWVKELVPSSSCYADAYDMFDMLGNKEIPAIMAHCVYSGDEEQDILKKNGVYIAHCPESNINVSSGIAPIRRYLEKGLNIGLGSDIAAGSNLSIPKAMALAIQASKMYWRLVDQETKPLCFEEVFYLATLGGGSYFGKVGTFKEGYDFDVVIVDDSKVKSMRKLTVRERIERMIYQENECKIIDKYVAGRKI